jgi:hypothetical protein
MNHPLIGQLHPCPSGGWRAVAVLPAFRPCYERWDSAGRERPDTRDEQRRRGDFWVYFLGAAPGRAPRRHRRGRPTMEEAPPPSAEQAAAFDYLVCNQARVAQELFSALAREAPRVFPGEYHAFPSEAVRRLIATAAGVVGAVELEGVGLGVEAEAGCVRAGFAFHSDLLEPEHGVGVVMHRDRVVSIGHAEEAMQP